MLPTRVRYYTDFKELNLSKPDTFFAKSFVVNYSMNNDENNRRPLAWVTGASGLIGSHVVQSAESYAPKWEIRGLSRKDFDLTDFPETQRQ